MVLQYFISHLYITNQIQKIENLFDSIIQNIVLQRDINKPFIIIINDVNSINRGRDLFINLYKKIEEKGIEATYRQYYFDYRIKNEYQRYGEKHRDYSALFHPDSRIIDQYNPWLYCSSAQLIIEISKENTDDN